MEPRRGDDSVISEGGHPPNEIVGRHEDLLFSAERHAIPQCDTWIDLPWLSQGSAPPHAPSALGRAKGQEGSSEGHASSNR